MLGLIHKIRNRNLLFIHSWTFSNSLKLNNTETFSWKSVCLDYENVKRCAALHIIRGITISFILWWSIGCYKVQVFTSIWRYANACALNEWLTIRLLYRRKENEDVRVTYICFPDLHVNPRLFILMSIFIINKAWW